MKIDLSDYLKKKDGHSSKGICKACHKEVTWGREKLLSHKMANCVDLTDEEKELFHKRKGAKVEMSEPNSNKIIRNSMMHSFVDSLSVAERDSISELFARFFFRSGIPFRIADSAVLKDLVVLLRPSYAQHIPSSKSIRTTWLAKEYNGLFKRGKLFLSSCRHYSLVTDGWSNIRNQHMVNYVIVTPGNPPFFYKSISTNGISQTSKEIADQIIKIIEELGAEKCVSVVTDNASNMRGAWTLIESAFPHIFANGCGAHVMNLLVKDICELEQFSTTLSNVTYITTFVRDHQHVLARFEEYRKKFNIKKNLVLTVPTRWYTHFNSCARLQEARFALTSLSDDDHILDMIQRKESVAKYKRIINDSSFWDSVKVIINILKHPTAIIGKLEKDDCDLGKIYKHFKNLKEEYQALRDQEGYRKLVEIVSIRWNFIHTESMSFAFLLTPKYLKEKWVSSDKVNTKKQLKNYIEVFYRDNDDEIAKCKDQLSKYLTNTVNLAEDVLQEYNSLSGIQFWSQYGMSDYPLLAKIALRIFSVPTSSASAERVWSIFSFIHHKRRNRLKVDNVEKLAFIYINHCLLDSKDKKDYIGSFTTEVDSEDEYISDDLG